MAPVTPAEVAPTLIQVVQQPETMRVGLLEQTRRAIFRDRCRAEARAGHVARALPCDIWTIQPGRVGAGSTSGHWAEVTAVMP